MIPCTHHHDGVCDLGKAQGHPTPGFCAFHCQECDGPWRPKLRKQQLKLARRRPIATPSTPSPCSGCGGAMYDHVAFNRPGGADQLIQQLS